MQVLSDNTKITRNDIKRNQICFVNKHQFEYLYEKDVRENHGLQLIFNGSDFISEEALFIFIKEFRRFIGPWGYESDAHFLLFIKDFYKVMELIDKSKYTKFFNLLESYLDETNVSLILEEVK